eukprot:403353501
MPIGKDIMNASLSKKGKPRQRKMVQKQQQKRQQEFGLDFQVKDSRSIYQDIIPNSLHSMYEDPITSRVYNGRFTRQGNLYYASTQEELILYDTSNPFDWKLKVLLQPNNIHWTVLDMDVDKNEQFLLYSTFSSDMYLVDLETFQKKQETLKVGSENQEGRHRYYGMMSAKFSPCGKQTLSSSNRAQLLLYDLESNRTLKTIEKAHTEDINSVCFSHHMNPNIFYSGSDDCVIKVWDQRILNDNKSVVGKFIGHQQGITCVTGRNDGVYLASNGKDQLLKVWDLRKIVTPDRFKAIRPIRRNLAFDYRMHDYYLDSPLNLKRHPDDHSVLTFHGHSVLQTLIKCQFSPEKTTGQRYIITGSNNGEVFIFDMLSGDQFSVLNSTEFLDYEEVDSGEICCRDISWHPEQNIIAQTSFECAIKTWTYQSEAFEIKVPPKEKQRRKSSVKDNNLSDNI